MDAPDWVARFLRACEALGVEQVSLGELRRALKWKEEGVAPRVAAEKLFGRCAG